ncbi:hypothetical protein Hanom_Chr17g01577641 [Helianthus anomalus]
MFLFPCSNESRWWSTTDRRRPEPRQRRRHQVVERLWLLKLCFRFGTSLG